MMNPLPPLESPLVVDGGSGADRRCRKATIDKEGDIDASI